MCDCDCELTKQERWQQIRQQAVKDAKIAGRTVVISVADVESALRAWVADADYDMHKNFECGEETLENTYPEEAAKFFRYLGDNDG
ncbi:hypothetical protein [Streptomyces sp. NPDC055085]